MTKSIEDFLEEVKKTVEPVRLKAIHLFDERIEDEEVRTALKYAMDRGKGLREWVTLESCRLVGGAVEKAYPLAMSFGIYQSFTLIIDDKRDEPLFRRGNEPLYLKYGHVYDEALAWLVRLSTNLLDQADKTGEMNKWVTKMINEMSRAERKRRMRQRMTIAKYRNNCRDLSGSFYSTAFRLGAICGRGSSDQTETLAEAGGMWGTAYQLRDDLMDKAEDTKRGFYIPKSFNTIREVRVLCKNALSRLKSKSLYSEKFSNYIKTF